MADFAAVVRRYMDERGVGIRALARAVNYDPSYLSKIVRGVKPCGAEMARRIDRALGAGGEIVNAASSQVPALPSVTGGHVAPELADYFGSQLASHYKADRFLGPARLIPVALSQYELLCDVAGEASGSLRMSLWGIAAGFGGLIGWLYQDAGDLAASGRWHDVMIERAHRSHDLQLVAFALHCKAMLHTDMGDGPGVLDLVGSGLRLKEQLCPKVRVLLLQQAAHGTALAGGDGAESACARLLDEAAGLVDAVDDDYPWGGNCQTPRYVDVQRATILNGLGHSADAVALWERVTRDIPSSSRRDLGVYRARQAQALAGAGEPEHAAMIGAEVVPLAVVTGSARMKAELTVLRQRMQPWRNEPAGRALDQALAGIGRR
jgi:hypothetical protein